MPFKAYATPAEEQEVTPGEIQPREDVYCCECGGRMRVRRGHRREDGVVVIRHFTHHAGQGSSASTRSCRGGEGDPHLRAKAVLVQTLDRFYPDGVAESERSFTLPAQFDQRTRVADAVVTFDDPKPELGAGIAVEVQDKHKDKDVRATTRAYLSRGYSVCWLSVDEFGTYSLLYDKDGFEDVVRTAHPDSDGVFGGALTSDGRVPRKELYPLGAPIWPHGVDVARETRPRADAGWSYPALELPIEADLDDDDGPSTPTGEVPFATWAAAEEFQCRPGEARYTAFMEGVPLSPLLELPIGADLDDGDDPTTPTGEVPFSTWIASEESELRSELAESYLEGVYSDTMRGRDDVMGKIKRVVEYNTGAPQPDAVPEHTIVMLASRSNIAPQMIRPTIREMRSEGVLEEPEPDRYRLAGD